ncbi:head-tail connector protein [Zavarzinia sp. CC-PAN008]|uniref:head-tail connector protein n=1 Tax=Zavarzinia sp. CC-PAN008 TaxID=3243332 RepID=UPI003F7427CC
MPLELTEAPSVEPLSLEAMKVHLRLETDDEDALVLHLVAAARSACEAATGRALLDQAWCLWLDAWPDRAINLPRPPLRSLTGVSLFDGEGAEVALSADDWTLDTAGEPARIRLDPAVRPASARRLNAIAIRYRAGYGTTADQVPAPLVQGIALLAAHWYERREAVADPTLAPVPYGVAALWAPYRLVRL